MKNVTFSKGVFRFKDSDNPDDTSEHLATLEGIDTLLSKLWDSPYWDTDFENCLKPENRAMFSKKAYFELMRLLTAVIADHIPA